MENEEWFNTLKEGGTITSAKPGITNLSFGGKKKEEEEEEYRIIPEDDDFWRSEITKMKRKKWMDAVDKLMSDGRERTSRQILDNDIINNRRDAPFTSAIVSYLKIQAKNGKYIVTKRRPVGDRELLHFKIVEDDEE